MIQFDLASRCFSDRAILCAAISVALHIFRSADNLILQIAV
jgi:hypothetical protein